MTCRRNTYCLIICTNWNSWRVFFVTIIFCFSNYWRFHLYFQSTLMDTQIKLMRLLRPQATKTIPVVTLTRVDTLRQYTVSLMCFSFVSSFKTKWEFSSMIEVVVICSVLLSPYETSKFLPSATIKFTGSRLCLFLRVSN